MSILKKTSGIILSLIIALSVIAVPTSVFAAEEKGITINRFGGYTYKIKKEAGYRYDIKVSDNGSKAIAAEIAYSETSDYVDIAALKKTGNTKPKVEVIKESNVTGEKTTIATFYNTQKYTNSEKKHISLLTERKKELLQVPFTLSAQRLR